MIPLYVVALVLFSACLHATWNAMVKGSPDTFLSSVLVVAGCGSIAAVALPFLPGPDPASWPFIAASVLAQLIYIVLLAAAYRTGDMSQTYPLMRGVAPLLVAIASGPVIGESLSAGLWLGVILISAGVAGMAFAGTQGQPRRWAGPGFALLNACVIASYTIIDGLGARRSGAPLSYAFWTFLFVPFPLVAWAVVRRGGDLRVYARRYWPVAVVGGAGTLVSYSVVLWAMTVSPVAVIASLRETAILFATALSRFVLKERIGPARLVSIGLIIIGAAAIKGS